jgi:hypothetical protein
MPVLVVLILESNWLLSTALIGKEYGTREIMHSMNA